MNALIFLVCFIATFWVFKDRDVFTDLKSLRKQTLFHCGVSILILAVFGAAATKQGHLELGLIASVAAGLVLYFSLIPVSTKTKYAYIISSLTWMSVALLMSKHNVSFAIDGLCAGTSAVTAYNIHKYFKL